MEITAKRRDELIDWFVGQCTKRGLITPAIMFVEINRPFSFLASSAATFFAPIFGTYLPPDLMEEIASLLEDRRNVDLLIDRLERAGEDETRREAAYRAKVKEDRERRRQARLAKGNPPDATPPDTVPPDTAPPADSDGSTPRDDAPTDPNQPQ